MKKSLIAVSIVLALCLAACDEAPPPVDKAAIEKTIRDYEASWAKEMTQKDPVKAAGHYTSDGILMGSGMPAAKGPDAIKSQMKELFADPNANVAFTTDRVEVAGSGDMAVTRGTYVLTMADPRTKKPATDKGSYVTVYHKQTDGSWKVSLDINASEVPPTPPPSAKKAAATRSTSKKKKHK